MHEPNEKGMSTAAMEARCSAMASLFDDASRTDDPIVEGDALLDLLCNLVQDVAACQPPQKTATYNKAAATRFLQANQSFCRRLQEQRLHQHDFELISKLARGNFGEVSVVRCKLDGGVYALKKQKKTEMLAQIEKANFMEEKSILALSAKSRWLPDLLAAFQDQEYIYLAMEYLAGGDIMSLCIRADEDLFHMDEAAVKFYIAETVLALADLHRLGYVHRDIKPENILLSATGHIKLADFGSCQRLNKEGKAFAYSAVGSPDYISPELLNAEGGKGIEHGVEVDVWSLGVTMFEMLFGDTPFHGETLSSTYAAICNHQSVFELPEDIVVSDDCKDLLQQMICAKASRIGATDGMRALQQHPWFKGIDWATLHEQKAPFQPTLVSPSDTSNFDAVITDDPIWENTHHASHKTPAQPGNQFPFIGYSYFKHMQGRLHFRSSFETSHSATSSPQDRVFEREEQQTSRQEKEEEQLADEKETFESVEATTDAIIQDNLPSDTQEIKPDSRSSSPSPNDSPPRDDTSAEPVRKETDAPSEAIIKEREDEREEIVRSLEATMSALKIEHAMVQQENTAAQQKNLFLQTRLDAAEGKVLSLEKQRDRDAMNIRELVTKIQSLAVSSSVAGGGPTPQQQKKDANARRQRFMLGGLKEALQEEVKRRHTLEAEMVAVKDARAVLEAKVDELNRRLSSASPDSSILSFPVAHSASSPSSPLDRHTSLGSAKARSNFTLKPLLRGLKRNIKG